MNREKPKTRMAAAIEARADSAKPPRVVAAGRGLLAERILDIARAQGIPVVADDELARELNLLEVGSVLPEELFPAVAEIIAHVYHIADLHRGYAIHPQAPGRGAGRV